jgi:hypothetical protein
MRTDFDINKIGFLQIQQHDMTNQELNSITHDIITLVIQRGFSVARKDRFENDSLIITLELRIPMIKDFQLDDNSSPRDPPNTSNSTTNSPTRKQKRIKKQKKVKKVTKQKKEVQEAIDALTSEDRALYEELSRVRQELANELEITRNFEIASNRQLHNMAVSRPNNRKALKSIKGMGGDKRMQYSSIFLRTINPDYKPETDKSDEEEKQSPPQITPKLSVKRKVSIRRVEEPKDDSSSSSNNSHRDEDYTKWKPTKSLLWDYWKHGKVPENDCKFARWCNFHNVNAVDIINKYGREKEARRIAREKRKKVAEAKKNNKKKEE